MAVGKRDSNYNVVLMGVSSVDGVTPTPLTVDPDTNRLLCTVAGLVGGTGNDADYAKRDDNREPVLGGARTDTDEFNPLTIESVNNGLMMEGI